MIYTLHTMAPASGHFWSFGPLPLSAPPILTDGKGARAYRIADLGDHNALYALESFAEMLPPPEGGIREVAMVEGNAKDCPKFWMHPAVRNDPAEIIPTLSLGGQDFALRKVNADGQSGAHNAFALDYESTDYVLRLFVRIMARSPVLHCEYVVGSKNRLPRSEMELHIDAKERIIGAPDLLTPAIRTVRLGRGGVDIGSFRIACELDGDEQPGEEPTALDVASAKAIEAEEQAYEGGFAFLPTTWHGEWLGAEAVTDPRGREWRERQLRKLWPFTSAIAAGQAGSQDSLGSTFSVPLWSEPDPTFVRELWENARDWAYRPCHIFEPGTIDPVNPRHKQALQTVARQPYGVELWEGQHVPKYGTRGLDGRTGHDEQHMAEMPLLAAYACTGSPALRWIIQSNHNLDLMQKRPQVGWRNNGRGEGRTGYCMLAAGLLLGGEARRDAIEHVTKRMLNASRQASTKDAPADAPARWLHLLSDPRLECEQPCTQVYEEAQFAWSSWLLYTMSGDENALEQAYRSGLACATAVWQQDGAWYVPYSVTAFADGRALPREQLVYPSPQVHFSGEWPIWWSGCGLHALVRAVAARPELVHPHHQEHIDRARQALEWLEGRGAPTFLEAHMALHGIPVPPAPVGGGS